MTMIRKIQTKADKRTTEHVALYMPLYMVQVFFKANFYLLLLPYFLSMHATKQNKMLCYKIGTKW